MHGLEKDYNCTGLDQKKTRLQVQSIAVAGGCSYGDTQLSGVIAHFTEVEGKVCD